MSVNKMEHFSVLKELKISLMLIFIEKNYRKQTDKVRKMFDEKFVRMWDLYLLSCAATFHHGIIDLHQVLFTKGINNQLPFMRWY